MPLRYHNAGDARGTLGAAPRFVVSEQKQENSHVAMEAESA
jgi:hypothetical protein